MSVPGSNILNTALSVIARQSFLYNAYTSRTLQPNGLYVSNYGEAVTLYGSVQPVPRNLYQTYGLDFDKYYVNFYVSQNVLDVSRDVAGDQFVFNGNTYQAESKTDWAAIDGWVAVLAVQVPAP